METATTTRISKKQKVKYKANKNSARALHFFVHFLFAVTARLQREMSNFTFNGGRKQATTKVSFSF